MKIKIFWTIYLAFLIYFLLPLKTFGATKIAVLENPDLGNPTVPGSSITDLFGLSANAIDILIGLLGAIAVIAIIFGGFQYITAGPDAEKSNMGRKTITYAVIGLVIILASLTIVELLRTTLQP